MPSIYFDRVFDRLRHLDQLEFSYWDASHRAEFFDPADSAEHELHHRPEAPIFDFNRQVEIWAGGPLIVATANVERDYLRRRSSQLQSASRGNCSMVGRPFQCSITQPVGVMIE